MNDAAEATFPWPPFCGNEHRMIKSAKSLQELRRYMTYVVVCTLPPHATGHHHNEETGDSWV